jgi:arylsulfatase A-like enzyme
MTIRVILIASSMLACVAASLAAAPRAGEEPALPAAAATTDEALDGGAGARPNVLLVSVDTLRADHTSLAGYGRETTPNLLKLASRALVFEQAFSASSWTPPSVASYLTSLHPIRHGMYGGPNRVAEDRDTLAEMLRAEGYVTRAVVQNAWFDEVFGYAQGFDDYQSFDFIGSPLCSDEVQSDVRTWLEDERDAPFFLWLHYFAPHCPYVPQQPWIDVYSPDEYSEHFEQVEFQQMAAFKRRLLDPADLERFVALYDSEINFVDEHIGALLDQLQASGLDQDTIVVFVADHGEEFKEHGSLGHYSTLHDELVRVPFLLALPGQQQGLRHTEPVSTTDLVPTLRAVLGLEPLEDLDGHALLARSAEGELESDLGTFAVNRPDGLAFSFRYSQPYRAHEAAEVLEGERDQVVPFPRFFQEGMLGNALSVRDARFTLICETSQLDLEASKAIDRTYKRAATVPFLAMGRYYQFRLYDRLSDPKEQVDVIEQHPDVALRLSKALREEYRRGDVLLPRAEDTGGPDVPPEVRKQLEELGYTGGDR